jgi:hypothetical protein
MALELEQIESDLPKLPALDQTRIASLLAAVRRVRA